jgi:hypothetical protein
MEQRFRAKVDIVTLVSSRSIGAQRPSKKKWRLIKASDCVFPKKPPEEGVCERFERFNLTGNWIVTNKERKREREMTNRKWNSDRKLLMQTQFLNKNRNNWKKFAKNEF